MTFSTKKHDPDFIFQYQSGTHRRLTDVVAGIVDKKTGKTLFYLLFFTAKTYCI